MFSVGLQQMSAVRPRYRDPGGEPTRWSSISARSRKFAGDQSGSFAWWSAIWLLMGMVVIGGAVDLGRWLNARTDLRSAVDSAVLAAARTLQSNGGDQAEAVQAAKDYLTENTKNIIPLNAQSGQPDNIANLIQFEIGSSGTEISAKGAVDIESRMFAAFKAVFDKFGDTTYEQDFSRIPLFRGTGADETSAKLRVGADAKRNIEVSVMLDITGSMGGSKLSDMKAAAKNLVDIIIWDDQTEYKSRVALVPFSEAINIQNMDSSILRSTSSGSDDKSYKKLYPRYGSKKNFYRRDTCVVERQGSYKYSDAAPNNQDARFRRMYQRTSCAIAQPVVPLSSDKTMLRNTIDSFQASGATAGHLGTEWAWYMLSPNFGNYMPSASAPDPYAPVSQPIEERETRKYAVLMTDGTYNVQYCGGDNPSSGYSGVRDRNSTGSSYYKGKCYAANGSSATQARALCQAMKAKGIEVYTVGFQLPSGNAQQTMNECASSADHRYDAGNGEELQQAFNDIALQIAELYLNK